MISVTIDAGVIVAPSKDADIEEVYQYVDTLLDWRRLLEESWSCIYMSERAAEVLLEDGLYPFRDSLRMLFASKGIIEYDVNTVAQVVDRLLRLTPSFETYFGLKDVLAPNISTEPDLFSFCATEKLASDLARCVVLIAVLRNHCINSVNNHTLIIRCGIDASTVNVRALIEILDHERDDVQPLPEPPDLFEGPILVCDNFRGLIQSIDEIAVCKAAVDEVGMELAARIALYKLRLERGLEPEWDDVKAFALGNHFLKTAKRCFRDNPDSLVGKVLRAIAETNENLRLEDTHALRRGSAGKEPQRMRGQDKAWRRDIDYEYHLHYWECHNGTVEFACVVTHNDFSIPE